MGERSVTMWMRWATRTAQLVVGLRRENDMRILISTAIGLGIGVLFLVDVLGWISGTSGPVPLS